MVSGNGKHRAQTLPDMRANLPPPVRTFSLNLDGNCVNTRAPVARGGFSDVYRVQLPKYGLVAVKRLRFNDTERDDLEVMVAKEARILTMIDHPHILRFLGITYIDGAICIVSPWAENGPLSSYLVRKPDADRLGLLAQVASALTYLHTNAGDIIIHGDLHVDNVLISHMETALLSDFGLSRIVPEGNSSSLWLGDSNDSRIGRVVYEAPELHEGARRSWATDVFAFGMLIFHAFSGKQPFAKAQNYIAAVVALFQGRRPDRAEIKRSDFSDGLWELVCQCWGQCPQSRPRMPLVARRMEILLKERNRYEIILTVSTLEAPVFQLLSDGPVVSFGLRNVKVIHELPVTVSKMPPLLGAGQYRSNSQTIPPFWELGHSCSYALPEGTQLSDLAVKSVRRYPTTVCSWHVHDSHPCRWHRTMCLIVSVTHTAMNSEKHTARGRSVTAYVRRDCDVPLSCHPMNQSQSDPKVHSFILVVSHGAMPRTKSLVREPAASRHLRPASPDGRRGAQQNGIKRAARNCSISSFPLHSPYYSRLITLLEMSPKFDGAVGKEEWASSDIGARYKPGERITGVVARALLEQSGALFPPRVALLDNACGTGIVAHEFHAAVADDVDYEVTCADFSDGMVETVRKRAKLEGWTKTQVTKADAQDTKLPSAQFTHVLTSLGFGIFPDSDAALNEIERVLVPGGTLGLTTWKHIGWPQLLQRGLSLAGCSSIILPDLLATSLARTGYDWSSPKAIEDLLTSRGYTDVTVRVLPTATKFSKAEIVDGDMGRMPLNMIMSLVSAEERAAWQDKVLPALSEHWDEIFGETEGMYSMEMTAIVATAQKH